MSIAMPTSARWRFVGIAGSSLLQVEIMAYAASPSIMRRPMQHQMRVRNFKRATAHTGFDFKKKTCLIYIEGRDCGWQQDIISSSLTAL